MNAILDVLRARGVPLRIEELDSAVQKAMNLPRDVVAVPHEIAKPDRSEVNYRMAWARSYLKKAGLIHNPARATWGVTDKGRAAGQIDPYALTSSIAQTYRSSGEEEHLPDDDEYLQSAEVGVALEAQLKAVYAELSSSGELLAKDKAAAALRSFRDRFGPDALAGLDGEPLLLAMHERGTHDSLVYWLEFKADDELPGRFGSISGGSAMKFGVYQSAETREWMQPVSNRPARISLEEAIRVARSQRDQLLAAASVLEEAQRAKSIDYPSLQQRISAAAPDIAESSWVHKYLMLLFPELLEPFHGAEYQRHQLRKLLKLAEPGRYANARIFAGVASQLGLSLLDLGSVLHQRNGSPHGYWRVGTSLGKLSTWEAMRDGGFMAVGWSKVGDLAALKFTTDDRERLRIDLSKHYESTTAALSRQAGELQRFCVGAHERDLVVAMDGTTVRGVGRITGPYEYAADEALPHRRPVEWLVDGGWKLSKDEGLQTTFVKLDKYEENLIEIESRLVAPPRIATQALVTSASVRPAPMLTALPRLVGRIESILNRKRQVILFGPPGTGKTHWAEIAAAELSARRWFGLPHEQLSPKQTDDLRESLAVEICTFHPAYGYEDFIEGYRPQKSASGAQFELRDGIFKRACARAARTPNKPFFLIIDEINRGDIPRIFGELLMLIEKRGASVVLPLSAEPFSVPGNLYILGTMNTADRSIALLDVALRRRFGFVELLPDSTVLGATMAGDIPIGPWLDALNKRVLQHAGRDSRHLQVGHSYLMPDGKPVAELTRFVDIVRDDIVPLLEEYCYSDYEALERIMGSGLVVTSEHRIRHELFEPDRHGDFVQALLSSFSELSTARRAIEAVAMREASTDETEETPA